MAFPKLKVRLHSIYVIVILLWITLPEFTHSLGICYKKYVKRTGKCRKKIFERNRVILMDFMHCCRRKDAQAWRVTVNGIRNCIICPNIVDGGWSQWTAWSRCPVTCDWGNHTRNRKCNNPVPQHGGKECKGDNIEIKECYSGRRCPIDGKWGPWSDWLACSKSCNKGGVQFRSRKCDSPRPDFGGSYCVGSSEESRKCNEDVECPVHGSWNSWNAWSACSSECISVRERKCDNPAPKHGGKACDGLPNQKSSCPGHCSKSRGGSGSGSGSEGGSGYGSGSSGSGDDGIDVTVETGKGIVTVKPTSSTKNISITSGSGEGSGEGGSGLQIDDNEPGDAIVGDGNRNMTKGGKGKIIQVDGGSGGSGYGEIDVTVEKASKKPVESKSSKKKGGEGAIVKGPKGTTEKDLNGKATTGSKGDAIRGEGGSGESGYGEIDVTVEKATQKPITSSEKKVGEGSGESGSGSRIDDSELGDTSPDDGSGKAERNDSKNAIQVEGSGGGSDSSSGVIVEKHSQNRNTVETKEISKNSKKKPGWSRKFQEIKG